jgi:predicted nucleic-acid-binding protein
VISIDTNVLLRYLLQDDKEQAALANKLIDGEKKVLVTDIVLTETIWTLKGKKYKLKKENILRIIEQLFKEPNLTFEDAQTVWRVLNIFRGAQTVKIEAKKKEVDFADVLILEKSKYVIARKQKSFDGLYSFDVAAQQITGINNP